MLPACHPQNISDFISILSHSVPGVPPDVIGTLRKLQLFVFVVLLEKLMLSDLLCWRKEMWNYPAELLQYLKHVIVHHELPKRT